MTSYGIEVRDDIGNPEEELKEREKKTFTDRYYYGYG